MEHKLGPPGSKVLHCVRVQEGSNAPLVRSLLALIPPVISGCGAAQSASQRQHTSMVLINWINGRAAQIRSGLDNFNEN